MEPTLRFQVYNNVQKFLGLADYYRRFIEGFASIARPLYDMVKKDQKWDWTERQKKAFGELKERFTKEPVLAAPDLDKKSRMKVDVSDYATEECYRWSAKMDYGDRWHFYPNH